MHKRVFPFACSFAVAMLAPGCGARDDAPALVTGSAHLAAIVVELGGGDPPVRNLIPGGMCPGHFDFRPSDIEAASGARAMLIHGWQRNMGNIAGLIAAAHVPEDRVVTVEAQGSWMVPAMQARAVRDTAAALGKLYPERAVEFSEKAEARARVIEPFGEAERVRIGAKTADIPVLCNEQQAAFAEWAGFTVAGQYGRAEDMSAATVGELRELGRKAGVKLVADNLQSGATDMGETLARETGAAHVVLTNFPGASSPEESWEDALRSNVDILIAALE